MVRAAAATRRGRGTRVRERTVEALDATSSAVQAVRISLERSDRPVSGRRSTSSARPAPNLESLAEDLS